MLRKHIEKILKRMQRDAYYTRGKDYFESGAVIDIQEWEGTITAQVMGTHLYTVEFSADDGEFFYDCNCPLGDELEFCKHCVAAGLAVLALPKAAPKEKYKAGKQIRAYLQTLEKDTLIEFIMAAAKADRSLKNKLTLNAATMEGAASSIDAWKSAFNRSCTPAGGFIDYYGMGSFANDIHQSIEVLADWIKAGRADIVVDLAEHAAARVEKLGEYCDDSNGELGDLLYRIGEIHVAACNKAKPDPLLLAGRLFKFALEMDWDFFPPEISCYVEALGEAGLAEYRKFVAAEWEKLPALKPGDQEDWSGHRFRISAMMETLAEQSGDLETWIAVKARNLSAPYAYLQIAEAYRKHNQREQAMHWAEQGLAAFAEKPDYALIEFLIEEYCYHKLPDKALALAWKRYEGRPELQYYKALHAHCAKSEWPALREQALSWLRDSIKHEFGLGKQSTWRRTTEPDQTRVVEILLWEKKIDDAWAEANAGVCDENTWLRLAEKRAAQHPEDAVKVYKWLVNKRVPLTNNQAYAAAVELVKKIKPIMTQSRGKNAFGDYLAELRVSYKAKRNFIKLMDKL